MEFFLSSLALAQSICSVTVVVQCFGGGSGEWFIGIGDGLEELFVLRMKLLQESLSFFFYHPCSHLHLAAFENQRPDRSNDETKDDNPADSEREEQTSSQMGSG